GLLHTLSIDLETFIGIRNFGLTAESKCSPGGHMSFVGVFQIGPKRSKSENQLLRRKCFNPGEQKILRMRPFVIKSSFSINREKHIGLNFPSFTGTDSHGKGVFLIILP